MEEEKGKVYEFALRYFLGQRKKKRCDESYWGRLGYGYGESEHI